MKIDELKAKRQQDTERLREQMQKDWKEILEDKFKWIAGLFGVKIGSDSIVRWRKIRK